MIPLLRLSYFQFDSDIGKPLDMDIQNAVQVLKMFMFINHIKHYSYVKNNKYAKGLNRELISREFQLDEMRSIEANRSP
jgi:hypothetical protein